MLAEKKDDVRHVHFCLWINKHLLVSDNLSKCSDFLFNFLWAYLTVIFTLKIVKFESLYNSFDHWFPRRDILWKVIISLKITTFKKYHLADCIIIEREWNTLGVIIERKATKSTKYQNIRLLYNFILATCLIFFNVLHKNSVNLEDIVFFKNKQNVSPPK